MIGKVHCNITTEALSKCFSKEALKLMCKANKDSDRYFLQVPRDQHFIKSNLKDGRKFVMKVKHEIINILTEASRYLDAANSEVSTLDPQKHNDLKYFKAKHFLNKLFGKAVYFMGRLSHAIQDFYAHTNWIHLTGVEQKIWNMRLKKINISIPDGFELKNCGINIVEEALGGFKKKYTRKNIEKKIIINKEFYEKIFLKPDKENERITHRILGKDCEGTFADEIFGLYNRDENGNGISGFNIAFADALKHTFQIWIEIRRKLNDKLGDSAKPLLDALSNWEPSDKKVDKTMEKNRISFTKLFVKNKKNKDLLKRQMQYLKAA